MAPPIRLLRAGVPAALLCALGMPARAVTVPSCHKHPEKTSSEVLTLDAMSQCQNQVLQEILQEYSRKRRRSMTADAVSVVQDVQRAEMQEFLQAHPDRALIDEERRLDPESEARLKAAETEPQGFLGLLGSWFGMAKGQLESLFARAKTGDALTENPEAARAVALTQKGLKQRAAEAGTLKEDGSYDAAATLGHSIKKYNEELDQNVDPSMRKFFKKPGQKDQD